jgi:hypothetical protein
MPFGGADPVEEIPRPPVKSRAQVLAHRALSAPPDRNTSLRRAVVLVAVVLATTAIVASLDSALGLYDSRADRHAEMSHLERLYGDKEVVVGHSVVEDAQALMPHEAPFAVAVGPNLRNEGMYTQFLVSDYLKYFLVPRRRVELGQAEWLFCIGCDRSELPRGFEPLSESGDGVVFGRVRR